MKTKSRFRFSIPFMFTVAFALAPSTFAGTKMVVKGGRVGNGGGLVVCRDSAGNIRSVELLDFYESRTHHGNIPNFGPLTGGWMARTQQLIDRLGRLSPFRKELYSQWLSTYQAESLVLTDAEFSLIPDSAHVAVPAGCAFEQGAVQIPPRFTGDRRYFVNFTLWAAMNDNQRAGLVLHELIYREALGYGHEDSVSVRHLTGIIASARLPELNLNEYVKLLQQARFELTDIPVHGQELQTSIDLRRLWADADASESRSYETRDRALIDLGRCFNGCRDFAPVPADGDLSLQGNEDLRLHPWTESFSLFGTEFSRLHESQLRPQVTSFGIHFLDGKPTAVVKSDPHGGVGHRYPFSVRRYENGQPVLSGTLMRAEFPIAVSGPMRINEVLAIDLTTEAGSIRGNYCSLVSGSLIDGRVFRSAFTFPDHRLRANAITGSPCLASDWEPRYLGRAGDWTVFVAVPENRYNSNTIDQLHFDTAGNYLTGGRIVRLSSQRLGLEIDYMANEVPGESSGSMLKLGDLNSPEIAELAVIGRIRATTWQNRFDVWMNEQQFSLHRTGMPKSAVVEAGSKIVYRDGTGMTIASPTRVNFDEQGFAIR